MKKVPQTIEDIRNPKRKSGFDHVTYDNGGTGSRKPYRGIVSAGWRVSGKVAWRGPRRATAEEAAQDYINYVNGGATPATLITAGHEYVVDERDTDPEYQAALGVLRDRRAQRQGRQGYVYLIVEELPGGALIYGKIGYSVNPRKRVAELQTGNPRMLRLHAMKPGTEADEAALHQKYVKSNSLQEWFLITKELLLEWDAEHIVRPAAVQRAA